MDNNVAQATLCIRYPSQAGRAAVVPASLAGISISPQFDRLEGALRDRLIQKVFERTAERDGWSSFRLILPEEVQKLSEVFGFVERLRVTHELPVSIPMEFRVARGLDVYGRASAVQRAVEIERAIFERAISPELTAATIDARGSLAHEITHGLGHVRVTLVHSKYVSSYACVRATGLRVNNGFGALEEYVASRVQALYCESHGFPEARVEGALALEQANDDDAAISRGIGRFLNPRPADAGAKQGSIMFDVPMVEQSLRPKACSGIIRHAVYEIAAIMFPDMMRHDAIAAFDCLAFRAQALGEYRQLFEPMVASVGAPVVRVLREISFGGRDPRPYLLIAALGEAVRSRQFTDAEALQALDTAAIAQRKQKEREAMLNFM